MRILSCIQPTGMMHLGNYLGAVSHWVSGQTENSYHGIVDLHALTVSHDGPALRLATRSTAAQLLAAGIDPSRTTLFVQSMVKGHTELGWIMECTIGYGELARMTQFKDKSTSTKGGGVSAGLFTYPALMAADILLYQTDRVPVGDDQRQHLELARTAAERFNTRFGETFRIPEASIPPQAARVMDLQRPDKKMSKSTSSPNGIVYLLDTPDEIARKVRRAVTDSESGISYDPTRRPGVANLLTILAALRGTSPEDAAGGLGSSGELKSALADTLIDRLDPIRRRYGELEASPGTILELLEVGSANAQRVAAATLHAARSACGLGI